MQSDTIKCDNVICICRADILWTMFVTCDDMFASSLAAIYDVYLGKMTHERRHKIVFHTWNFKENAIDILFTQRTAQCSHLLFIYCILYILPPYLKSSHATAFFQLHRRSERAFVIACDDIFPSASVSESSHATDSFKLHMWGMWRHVITCDKHVAFCLRIWSITCDGFLSASQEERASLCDCMQRHFSFCLRIWIVTCDRFL